jgi:amidase
MATQFDPEFGSALDAAAAIRSKKISSLELTEHTLHRIDAFQPKVNAYVYQLREQALAGAREADEALARGEAKGVFHGVPVNVKESFGVLGQPCTWGIPAFKDARSAVHSVAVRLLLEAGAILLGATNVPLYLMDTQSANELYGVTNNPWDLTRTPGGSSGGSSASLAAGMAFFSLGSDIGGSLRNPASFCGIYAHKPTLDIVSRLGHLPGGASGSSGFSSLLAVAGPMARTAEDLEAGLHFLAGPEPPFNKAWRFALPEPRHQSLREFRIGYVLEDPAVPVSAETKAVLEDAVRACERVGATLQAGWPAGFSFPELLQAYHFHLGAFDFSVMPPGRQDALRPRLTQRSDPYAIGALSSFAAWQQQNIKRLAYRGLWERYFKDVDVFLLPTTFTTAFPHTTVPAETRMIPTPEGGLQPFHDMLGYITPATLTGCPATAAPAGLSKSGLPVGLQVVGPYLEDTTPLRFAALLAREIGGFQAPKGFEAVSAANARQ